MYSPLYAQNTPIGAGSPTVVAAGPMVAQDLAQAEAIARQIAQACAPTRTPWIFALPIPALQDATGVAGQLGLHPALTLLTQIGDTYEVPTMAWVHSAEQLRWAADAIDILALPSAIQDQPEIIDLAAQSGRLIVLAPGPHQQGAAAALQAAGNAQIIIQMDEPPADTPLPTLASVAVMGDTTRPDVLWIHLPQPQDAARIAFLLMEGQAAAKTTQKQPPQD